MEKKRKEMNFNLFVRYGVLAVYGHCFLEHHVNVVLQFHMKITRVNFSISEEKA